MLTRLKLGNFKSWRELDIELAPITLLYGTNSSGKTSILQALLLLKQTEVTKRQQAINFGGSASEYVDLGAYEDVIHKHDISLHLTISVTWRNRYFDQSVPYDQNAKNILFGESVKIWGMSKGEAIVLNESPEDIYALAGYGVELSGMLYLGPLRWFPRRVIIWRGTPPQIIDAQGENTADVLINSQRNDATLVADVETWLHRLGLLDRLIVRPIDKNDRFYEMRIHTVNSDVNSSLADVGFGISQILPVVTMLLFVPEGSIVLIEQPELHLHPSAQAALADLFLEVAEKRKLQLIIESHSEHLLTRFQRRIAEPQYEFATPQNVKAYFCKPGENGSTIEEVRVNRFGQIENYPPNFFGDLSGDLDAMFDAGTQRRLEELEQGE